MERDWEQTFRDWSKPSGITEQEKCENAERMIGDAIRESRTLAWRSIEVFAQGSYRNNTNVRQESDVDICVCLKEPFFTDFSMASGFTAQDVGLVDSLYTYAQFKEEVRQALVAKFGACGVTRGNKAIELHENTYRMNADVVPCFEHRRYDNRTWDGQYSHILPAGAEIRPDNGGRIINWPRQHYANGVIKNGATGNRFKFITRALKRLRIEMEERGVAVAKPIPSYLIECLVWNVLDNLFGSANYTDNVRSVLAYTCLGTASDDGCREWREVNDLKYLFWIGQPWTRTQANAFLDAAWNYINNP